MNRGVVEEARLFRDGCGPSFGLRYDFRRRLSPGDYTTLYAGRPEEIEEGASLSPTGAWLSEHRLVDDGCPPSPVVVAAAVDRHGRACEVSPFVASGVAFVREDAGRAKKEFVGPDVAYGRTRYTGWGADRKRPRPGPLREGDLPRERYLVGTREGVAGGQIGPSGEAPGDLSLFVAGVAPRVRDAVRSKPA